MTKPTNDKPADDGQQYVYRPYRTLPNGTKLWAKAFGLKAWKIPVSALDGGSQGG